MPLNLVRVVVHWVVILAGVAVGLPCEALEVNLTEIRPYVEVKANGEAILVKRIQDTAYTINGFFAKTSRPCPPFCIRPIEAAFGVRTIAEYEMFDFMSHQFRDESGVIVDARTPDWCQRGTIPGATNLPWDRIEGLSGNPEEKRGVLTELGVAKHVAQSQWITKVSEFIGDNNDHDRDLDFARSKELIVFCNGPWSDQSQRAINALIGLGYPAEKIFYYRGGMQAWVSLGLTTVVPKTEGQASR